MEWQTDFIVDIPEKRIKFFGGPGKMLLPSPQTVAAVVRQVPAHHLITTDLLRQRLARQFNVRATCPVTTRKALQALAGSDQNSEVAYWRVINKNGTLMAGFPEGTQSQGEHLKHEGFSIDTAGKTPRVDRFQERLVRFEEHTHS